MITKQLSASLAAIILISCGGSEGQSSTPTPPPVSNTAPLVFAGNDQTVDASAEITLAATASDAEGDSINSLWTQLSGEAVTLSDSSQLTVTFTSPEKSTGDTLMFEFKATDSKGASTTDAVQIIVNPPIKASNCVVSDVPAALRDAPYNLDGFYQKYCDVRGLPLLGSLVVSDEALEAAHERAEAMLSELPEDVINSMISLNTRIAIMAESEVTTDIPEHSDLYEAFPGTDWDTRARGLGPTFERPAISAAEENLLCLSSDTYFGEDIFVHEFTHAIHIMGLAPVIGNFDGDLKIIFDQAIAEGLWAGTYAATNEFEYLGEGVQSWFNVNQVPQDGIHNDINTRTKLKDYDPRLHDFIAQFMPTNYQPRRCVD